MPEFKLLAVYLCIMIETEDPRKVYLLRGSILLAADHALLEEASLLILGLGTYR